MKFKVGEEVINYEGKVFTITKITPFTKAEQEMSNQQLGNWYWDNNDGYQESAIRKLTKLEKALK